MIMQHKGANLPEFQIKRLDNKRLQFDNRIIDDSGERLFPDFIMEKDFVAQKLFSHTVKRYEFAARYTTNKCILDIACGSGWGSNYLAAASGAVVTGVDCDEDTIEFAQHEYAQPLTQFRCGSVTTFCDGPFDTVVSLETIEHVEDPSLAVQNLKRLCAPNGRVIVSATISPTRDFYQFHLHDFTEPEFVGLVQDAGLKITDQMLVEDHFSPAELRASYRIHRPPLDLAQIRSRPLGWLANVGDAFIFSGLEFRNLTLACAIQN